MTRPLKIEGGSIAQFEDGDILTMTGLLNLAAGADIASASTVDLTAATGNCPKITGTADVEAWTMNTGQQMKCIAGGAFKLVYDATTNNIEGGADYTCEAGDIINLVKGLDGVVRVRIEKQDGTPVVGGTQIQPITASVASNALTITLNPTTLDFRDATLGSGTVNTRVIPSAISVVVSSGSTLGTVSGVPSRLAVLAIDNAGTVELAVVNMAGGVNLDETNLISTAAEGGAGGADSATVIYSTTARTDVPYRVVGFVESTQATAGTWTTTPSLIQGIGGKALTSQLLMSVTQATTSGTEVIFTAPPGAKKATVKLSGVSSSSTGRLFCQLQNATGDVTSGYVAVTSSMSSTIATSSDVTAFILRVTSVAADVYHGEINFTLQDSITNTWTCSGVFCLSNNTVSALISGSVTLTTPISGIRFGVNAGTFDAGKVSVDWSY